MKVWSGLDGPEEFKQELKHLIKSCSSKSKHFDGIVFTAIQQDVELELLDRHEMKKMNGVVGVFAQQIGVSHKLSLDHVFAFPSLELRNGEYAHRTGIPKWAPSRCMALAHEIAEATYAQRKPVILDSLVRYERSHSYAIVQENIIGREMGVKLCRYKNYKNSEFGRIPHIEHQDLYIMYGTHRQVIHLYHTPESNDIFLSYDIGVDHSCSENNFIPSSY